MSKGSVRKVTNQQNYQLGFILRILGSNAATLANNRHHSAQVIIIANQHFLIDCGETTRAQLNKYNINPHQVDHIFISHLHEDHYLGLMGLIFSMDLSRRKKDLHLYAFPGLAEIITLQLKHSHTLLNYTIQFHALTPGVHEKIVENELLTVHTIPLAHKIDCLGFIFRAKPQLRNLNQEKDLSCFTAKQLNDLKQGKDIKNEKENFLYKSEDYTLPPKKMWSYAYCSDTKYFENIIPLIQGVDLLYHEATFLEEQGERAAATFHSTSKQAATIAQKANVGKLLVGHFSSRYKDLTPLLQEAQTVFLNTELALEGSTFSMN